MSQLLSSLIELPTQTLVLATAVAVGAAALLVHAYLFDAVGKHGNLPPGPPVDSLFSGHRIPSTHPWRYLEKLTEEYGDIFTLRIGRSPLFVLGRASSAHRILEKQSALSSSRPRLVLAGELLSNNKRILLMPYGDQWRLYRKAMHETLNDTVAKQYEPIQEREARIATLHLGRLGQADGGGGDFQRVLHRYAASVIMQVTYDYQVQTLDDPLVRSVAQRGHALAMCIRPGASVLDRYPLLEHVPTWLNPWKQEGLRLRKLEQELYLGQVIKVRERMERGECAPCFVSKMTERQQELGLTDLDVAGMSGSLFGAGSDTTASALSIFVMAVCRYPAVLARLHEELDRVVSRDRMPTFDDIPQMPYVRATVQEVLRWRPVSAGGFQHSLTADVEYKGYVLPKGSTVVGPHWSISRDEHEYPEHDVFKPERFLQSGGAEANGTSAQDEVKGTWFAPARGSVAFGFGRRVCPGLNVAMRSLHINIACMAWAFDIAQPDGRPERVDTFAFNSAANSHPLPFDATFTYRDPARKGVVEEENIATGELDRIAASRGAT
ncbi:uncharacterized protein PFL1_03673 [Pseudozyma flocculosa PF-1]|uniref:Related to Cytochrome P450 n=2 Tax=Pseudozyma flocculosa TaxID=84751 RepID=A0A5C3F6N1_9BASI|nr:uncharacterized protein PFL1_03673 [Pseudozyma flocculosa PF-1]EPQ28871.1 hypothetical protein PFL1_03673 [Pseudozyma flocculosa PF-1]SPO39337.1 related to Cytochrome P450 [Pseudozyma flocculosa]